MDNLNKFSPLNFLNLPRFLISFLLSPLLLLFHTAPPSFLPHFPLPFAFLPSFSCTPPLLLFPINFPPLHSACPVTPSSPSHLLLFTPSVTFYLSSFPSLPTFFSLLSCHSLCLSSPPLLPLFIPPFSPPSNLLHHLCLLRRFVDQASIRNKFKTCCLCLFFLPGHSFFGFCVLFFSRPALLSSLHPSISAFISHAVWLGTMLGASQRYRQMVHLLDVHQPSLLFLQLAF